MLIRFVINGGKRRVTRIKKILPHFKSDFIKLFLHSLIQLFRLHISVLRNISIPLMMTWIILVSKPNKYLTHSINEHESRLRLNTLNLPNQICIYWGQNRKYGLNYAQDFRNHISLYVRLYNLV